MPEYTPGQRVQYDGAGPIPPPGSYYLQRGLWYGVTPNGLLAGLANHEVIVHEDGTITVYPSILVRGRASGSWHGYVERGVWREC